MLSVDCQSNAKCRAVNINLQSAPWSFGSNNSGHLGVAKKFKVWVQTNLHCKCLNVNDCTLDNNFIIKFTWANVGSRGSKVRRKFALTFLKICSINNIEKWSFISWIRSADSWLKFSAPQTGLERATQIVHWNRPLPHWQSWKTW